MDIWVHVKTPELEDTYSFNLNRGTTILDLTKKIKREKCIVNAPLAARFNQKVVNPMTQLCELTLKDMSSEKPIEMFIGEYKQGYMYVGSLFPSLLLARSPSLAPATKRRGQTSVKRCPKSVSGQWRSWVFIDGRAYLTKGVSTSTIQVAKGC